MSHNHAPGEPGADISSRLSAKLSEMDWDARLEEARKRRAEALAGRPPEPERPSIPPPDLLKEALPPEKMISEETLPEAERRHQAGAFGAPLSAPAPQPRFKREVRRQPAGTTGSANPPRPASHEVILGAPGAGTRDGAPPAARARSLATPPEPDHKPAGGRHDGQSPPGADSSWVPPTPTMLDTARASFEQIAEIRSERSAIVPLSTSVTTPEGGADQGAPHREPYHGDTALETLEHTPALHPGKKAGRRWALMALVAVILAAVAAAAIWGPARIEQPAAVEEVVTSPPLILAMPVESLFFGGDIPTPKPVVVPLGHVPVSYPTGLQSLPSLLLPAMRLSAVDDAAQPAPVRPHLVRIFVAVGTPTGVEARATERVEAGPSRVDGLVEVDYRIQTTHTRYFHRQDWGEATRLARALGGEARNFAQSGVEPPRGYIELYVQSMP